MLSYEAERKIKDLERKVQRIVVNRCEEMPTTNVGKIVIFESEIFFWNGAEYERILTTDDLAGLVTEEELAWLTQDIEDALVNANLPSETNPYATMDDVNAIVFPDPITVVANYAALPNPTTVSGDFYWAEASQGTSWLPGNLGGTYYPKGMYYSNGVSWSYIETPYQATQLEVDAGTNNDKFVTPLTGKTAYSFKPGIAGGQILNGGINASDNLTLSSTANATKGSIIFGDSRYNEATNRLVLGTATGTGRINLPDAGTTAADGISFGTSVSLFRAAPNVISTGGFIQLAGLYGGNYLNPITLSQHSGIQITANPAQGSSSPSALSISQTWNTTGSPTLISANVTNTASGGSSLLMDLKVGGVSQFKVSKVGRLTVNDINTSLIYANTDLNLAHSGGTTGIFIKGINGNVAIGNNTNPTLARLEIFGESLTGSTSSGALNITQTWNTTGAPSAIDLNITDNASNASSLFVNLRRNGSTVFSVRKDGNVFVLGSITGNSGDLLNFTNIRVSSGGYFTFGTARSVISSPVNGNILFQNAGFTDFNLLQFGGNTSSFPSLKRNLTNIEFRLADDSAQAGILANNINLGTTTGTGRINLPDAGTTAADGITFGPNARIYKKTLSGGLRFEIENDSHVFTAFNSTVLTVNNTNVLFSRAANIVLGALTGSSATSALSISQTWNTTGNPTLISANVTNTASGASANLMDLQVGGVSQFKVNKLGSVTFGQYAGEIKIFNNNATGLLIGNTSGPGHIWSNGAGRYFWSNTGSSFYNNSGPDIAIGRHGVNVLGVYTTNTSTDLAGIAANNINLGVATGTGRINLPDAGTTTADGIVFGGNSYIYRSANGVIRLFASEFVMHDNTTIRTKFICSNSFYGNYIDFSASTAGITTAPIIISGGSLTGSSATSALNISQTWNTTGNPSAIFLNITDTASGANANLMDLQVGGVSRCRINKNGNIFLAGNTGIDFTGSSGVGLKYYSVGVTFLSSGQICLNTPNNIVIGQSGNSPLFPSIKRVNATLETRLADDSGFAATQSLYQRFGSGSPEGVVTAPIGAIYHRTDGGANTSLYVKESGTGNTGWIAK